MKTVAAKLTYKVPADSPVEAERGKEYEKAFDYQQCESEDEAASVLKEKELSVLELVNAKLKAQGRANAYQAALAPHKPSTMSQDDAVESIVRAMIRQGIPESIARAQVSSLLENKANLG